jgi:hypothetical protein
MRTIAQTLEIAYEKEQQVDSFRDCGRDKREKKWVTSKTWLTVAAAFRARSAATNFIAALAFLAPAGLGALATLLTLNPTGAILGVLLGLLLAKSPKIARQWERAVVLRLGKFVGLRGAGLFWIFPFVDSISTWIDQRVITTGFAAEETLTSDTVPVNVDAVLFWVVYDPEKAALEVQNYPQAVSWAAQTALRDIIGRTSLSDLLRGRERIEDELQKLIDERSNFGRDCNRSRCAT